MDPKVDDKIVGAINQTMTEDTDTTTMADESDHHSKSEVPQTEKDGFDRMERISNDSHDGDDEDDDQTNADLEAQTDKIGAERLEATRTNASHKSHRSVFSKLSKSISKPKEKLPPPTLPQSDLDNNVVGWEGQDDPDMPLNWTTKRKYTLVALLSSITLMTPYASSIIAPALTFIAESFGTDDDLTVTSFSVSIFLLGYAIGPLFLSPMSELCGRNYIMLGSNCFFCVWLIGCALAPNLPALIVMRFLSGLGGSACQTIGGAIIADLFPVSERGRAMTFWLVGPMFGPSIAPVIGGYVSQSIGWRWTIWLTFIPAVVITATMGIFFRETNHQVLINRKVKKLQKELGRPELRSCYVDPEKPVRSTKDTLLTGLLRPLRMLFTSVIIFSCSLYIAFFYGTLYLLFTTIPIVFRGNYGWSIGTTGLIYLSILLGYIIGLVIFATMSDRSVARLTEKNNGVYEPEMRLTYALPFAISAAASFFIYGWTADQKVHFIVPIIGLVPFAFGVVGVWMIIQSYLIDMSGQYAASALAAFAVLRCVVATFLPLAGPKMYETLGIGWGTSLLGFLATAMIPIPLLIHRHGRTLRLRYPFKF